MVIIVGKVHVHADRCHSYYNRLNKIAFFKRYETTFTPQVTLAVALPPAVTENIPFLVKAHSDSFQACRETEKLAKFTESTELIL